MSKIFKKKDKNKYITIILWVTLAILTIEIVDSINVIQMGMKQWFLITLFGMNAQILIEKYFRE